MKKGLSLFFLAVLIAGISFTGCSSKKSSSKDTSTPVTGVTLKASTTIHVGDTEQLSPLIEPSSAVDQLVVWGSSNTSVATVNSTGLVTAKAEGKANITVTTDDGGKTATCEVTVTAAIVPVTGMTLDKTTSPLSVNGTITLTATIAPSGASNQNVTWITSNAAIASLPTLTTGGSMTITGVSEGTATITATTSDGGFPAKCDFTVSVKHVTGLTLDSGTTTIKVGNTQTLVPTISPTDASYKTVTWISDHPEFATVSSSGLVTAVDKGVAIITATSTDGGFNAACMVNVRLVNEPVTDVSLDKVTLALDAGSPGSAGILTATIAPSDAANQTLAWTTSDNTVAKLSATSGGSVTVTGYNAGIATIKVTTTDGTAISKTCTVTVTNVLATGVTLNSTNQTITAGSPGSTVNLTATISPTNASIKTLNWSTSDNTKASLSATTGSTVTVTGGSAGSATIMVTTTDGTTLSAICNITVANVSVTGVTLPANSTVSIGGTRTLAATFIPTNATNKNLTWSSDNSSVATVSATGVVTGIALGTANITATSAEGSFTATCAVTVSLAPTYTWNSKAFGVGTGLSAATGSSNLASSTNSSLNVSNSVDLTVNGGKLQSTSDGVYFVYTMIDSTQDFTITAEIKGISANFKGTGNQYAAGLMFYNADPATASAIDMYGLSGIYCPSTLGTYLPFYGSRISSSGSANKGTYTGLTSVSPSTQTYLKLVKVGTKITPYISTDGGTTYVNTTSSTNTTPVSYSLTSAYQSTIAIGMFASVGAITGNSIISFENITITQP